MTIFLCITGHPKNARMRINRHTYVRADRHTKLKNERKKKKKKKEKKKKRFKIIKSTYSYL